MEEKKISVAETSFCMYKLGMAGQFKTKLYDLFWLADTFNQDKLICTFPELQVARNYSNTDGYWQDLVKRWNKHNPNHTLYE